MNVLIIDDHDLFSEGLKLLLLSMNRNLNVDFVGSYAQTAEFNAPEDVGLILLDYHLDDGSGTAVLRKIRQRFQSATIVMISSDDSPAAIKNSVANGASGYIPKSSSRSILIAALDLVLSGGTYLPPQALNTVTTNANSVLQNALTERQLDVLNLVMKGKTNKFIAAELKIAVGTVKAHLFTVYKAFGVSNRTEAVLAFAKYKLEAKPTVAAIK